MTAEVFFDTNVLIYVDDFAYPAKQAVARRLLEAHTPVLSAQVLSECFNACLVKLKLDKAVAQQSVDRWRAFRVVPITGRLVTAAIETSIRHQVNYWDALIVEAAASAGCSTLLTEDLNDGQVISGVRVTNPFRGI